MKRIVFIFALAASASALAATATTARFGDLGMNAQVVTNVDFSGLSMEETDPTFNSWTNGEAVLHGPLRFRQSPDFGLVDTVITSNGVSGWQWMPATGGAGVWANYTFNWWDLLTSESDPTVPSWAKASSKPSYSWNEITGKPAFKTVATSGEYNDLMGKPTIPTTASEVGAVSAVDLPGEVYRIVAGTNIVDVVTNYDSAVHAPARYLQQLTTNGMWKTIWAETNGLARTLAAAKSETTAATNALAQVKADRAWSRHTSALGADAPEGTTWISTPTTVIAGGYEYARTVSSSGQYWFLTSNGLTLEQGATNSYLNVSAPDGTPIFRVEKTDSQLVGVRATEISMVGSVAIVSVPVVGAHPYARVASNLVNATWYKEDGDGMPQGSPATVAWSGSSGAWVATVDFGNSTQGFCYFEFLQEGVTKIVNNGVTELSGGIIFNGVKYMPTVNGNKLEFVAQ